MQHLTVGHIAFHSAGSRLSLGAARACLLLKDPRMGKYLMSLVLMLWWVVQLVTHA
jgi:hypothetical protein